VLVGGGGGGGGGLWGGGVGGGGVGLEWSGCSLPAAVGGEDLDSGSLHPQSDYEERNSYSGGENWSCL